MSGWTRAKGKSLLVALVLAALAACADTCDPVYPDAGPLPDGGKAGDELVDPLSMPTEPTLSVSNFTPSATCGECHVQHYEEWRTAMHAYATIDPVFRALVKVRQEDYGGAQDKFCLQCHSPIATRGGEIADNFSFDDLSEVALDGVGCETCHKVKEIARPYNSGLVLDEFAPMQGPIEDPQLSGFHASEKSDLLGRSVFCAACHDVIEVSGLNLERPYAEWLESPAALEGKTCQSCHMPTYMGRAVEDGPVRELHRHRFVGVDLPLVDGILTEEEREALKGDIRALLDGCGAIALSAPDKVRAGAQLDLLVTVRNNIDAHNLPTGATFIRQLWVEVTVTDAAGNVLYQTGHLDENGDLRDHFSELDPYGDDDLILLSSGLIDHTGAPEIFPWRATEHISNALSPRYERTFPLFIPTKEAAGPLRIEARLRFRSHPPYLLRRLGLEDKVERLEIYEIDAASLEVELVSD